MVLGGIAPVQVQTRPAVSQTGNPQAPAQTNSAVSSGNEQVNQGTPGELFSPENLKKWAPWIVGAILLYVLLNKKR